MTNIRNRTADILYKKLIPNLRRGNSKNSDKNLKRKETESSNKKWKTKTSDVESNEGNRSNLRGKLFSPTSKKGKKGYPKDSEELYK